MTHSDFLQNSSKNDEVVKSRHSRLSGIVVIYNVLKRDDSGQAGMTSKEGYSAFYETIKNDDFKKAGFNHGVTEGMEDKPLCFKMPFSVAQCLSGGC
jgi:hypothetical protein